MDDRLHISFVYCKEISRISFDVVTPYLIKYNRLWVLEIKDIKQVYKMENSDIPNPNQGSYTSTIELTLLGIGCLSRANRSLSYLDLGVV